jgi:MFS family permease
MYFQLKNLDSSLSSRQIVTQSATVSTAYIIRQCLSSIWISELADSPKCGRKKVLLLGTAASSKLVLRGEDSHYLTSILTVGCVSSHFYQLVVLWGLEGIFNGNVATARTIITEIVGEKK